MQGMRGFIAWGVANPLKVRFLDQCYNYPGIGEDVREQIYDELSWMAGLMHFCHPRRPPAGPAVRVPWHDGVPDHERYPRPDRIRGVRHVQ